jgi:hypothetical protein
MIYHMNPQMIKIKIDLENRILIRSFVRSFVVS